MAVASASPPQVRHVLGTVRTADDQSIGHVDVDIDGTDLGLATDKGAFSLDVPPFRVGFPYTFHVTGWVVVDPCVLARGRLYLPDPDAEKVPLKVARPGDSRLLSAKSIGCLFEEKASRYEPKQDQGAGPRSGLASGRPAIFAQQFMPRTSAPVESGRGQVRLVRVAYQTTLLALRTPIQAEGGKGMIGDDSLVQQAKELGFTAEQLRSAINGWRATMTDPYQRGLAALDSGRYAEAITYIAQSIGSGTVSDGIARGPSPNRFIVVEHNYVRREHTTTKSKKSRRVDMSRELRRVLIDLRDKRLLDSFLKGKNDISDELVFLSPDGAILDPDNLYHRYFRPVLSKAGLRKIRLHDLRHTFGSLLIQSGASIVYVKEQMGHSSIQVTVDTYGHLIPGANISFVDRLDVDEKDRESRQQNATQAQLALQKETEIPAEVLDLIGGGGRTRTYDLRIMRPSL